LWIKIYPINADASAAVGGYIDRLDVKTFSSIEDFIGREIAKYGHDLKRPVRIEVGNEITEQPPVIGDKPSTLDIMLWSLKIRWWASSVTEDQDDPAPDVRIFVRYHSPKNEFRLENSVGLQKGMVGIVNAFASRQQRGMNNVIIAHEFLHTLGATDKYDPITGSPNYPEGFAEPERTPRFPQCYAEIMGGRIAVSESDHMVPKGLRYAVIGEQPATEIQLR